MARGPVTPSWDTQRRPAPGNSPASPPVGIPTPVPATLGPMRSRLPQVTGTGVATPTAQLGRGWVSKMENKLRAPGEGNPSQTALQPAWVGRGRAQGCSLWPTRLPWTRQLRCASVSPPCWSQSRYLRPGPGTHRPHPPERAVRHRGPAAWRGPGSPSTRSTWPRRTAGRAGAHAPQGPHRRGRG